MPIGAQTRSLPKNVVTRTVPIVTPATPRGTIISDDTTNINLGVVAATTSTNLLGVTDNDTDLNGVVPVATAGIVQCRTLTGTAIAIGGQVKVADANGRITAYTAPAGSQVAAKGAQIPIVGIAQQAVASGAASDTLIDVLLTIGTFGF